MSQYNGKFKFPPSVYLFEESDVVQGGPDGIDNVPLKNLSDRTFYLNSLAAYSFFKLFEVTPLGSFKEGFQITSAGYSVFDESSKLWYIWTGSLPKTVSPGSDPSSTGGIYDPVTNPSGKWKALNLAIESVESLYGPEGASKIGTEGGGTVETALEKSSSRINGRNSVDSQISKSLNDIEVAYNALGATLDGNITHRVDFTSSQTDTASRILYALQNIPSGYVFERFLLLGSVYATMSIRRVAPRVTVGKPSITYSLNTYQGDSYHTAIVKGDYVNKMRMSYVDGTLRTPADTISYLNLRFVRLLVNASPVGNGQFCTTINNGKLIPGDPNNTYFLSSCFLTADGKLEVVPHKDTPVEEVVRNYYYNHDAVQAMHFRYVLVKDGEVYDLVSNGYTTPTGWDGQPSGRTSIGQLPNGDLVLAVIDGNTTAGTGVTIKRMSEYMLSLGCVNAMNLDGSGSSTMYYGNERKNSPSDGAERAMVNVIYFI